MRCKIHNTMTITVEIERDEHGKLTVSGYGTAEAHLGGRLAPNGADEEFVIRGRLGHQISATQYTLVVTSVDPAIEPVLSTAELAERLGIKPDSVRQRMGRWGIKHVEGWPADRVLRYLEGRPVNVE